MSPRERVAARAARELRAGDVVNLGIGIPTLVPRFLPPGHGVFLHSENGLLGVGPPPEGAVDPNLVDATKKPVTELPGAAFFDSAASFAMIRGGFVDVAVMGALQVSATGDLANWAVPGEDILGVGGAMDLASGARRLIVTMLHAGRDGTPKLVPECTLPLTARGVVDLVVTDLGVFRPAGEGFEALELAAGATEAQVRALTGAPFRS